MLPGRAAPTGTLRAGGAGGAGKEGSVLPARAAPGTDTPARLGRRSRRSRREGPVFPARAAPGRDTPGRRSRRAALPRPCPQSSPTSRWQPPLVPKETSPRTRAANSHRRLPAEAPATEDAPHAPAVLHCAPTGHTTAGKLAPRQPIAQRNSEFCPTKAHISHRPNGAAVALNHRARSRNQRDNRAPGM